MVGVGAMERAARAAVKALGELDPARNALAVLAVGLAARFDAGESGAPIARELRATLRALSDVDADVDREFAELFEGAAALGD
jgi:hypothetical protein